MSQITLPLYSDFAKRLLVTADGSTYTPPTLTLGDQLLIPLHLMQRPDGSSSSTLVETDFAVRSVRASIGKTMDAPAAGGWNVELEDPDHAGTFWTSASLALAIATGDLLTAVQTLFTHILVNVADVSSPAAGCWIFSTDAAQPYNLQGGTLNTLAPVSFVRVRPFQQGTKWWYEIRLIQAPLAFSDTFARVLPAPPSVTEVQAGAPATDTAPALNELQDIYFPPDFRGTYFFRFGFRRTPLINWQDGQDIVAAALNAMYSDGAERFSVTTPDDNHGQVEFIGDLGGAPQAELTVEVYSHPQGVITLELPLDRAEMATALRTIATITVPLEIEVEVVDDPDDLANLDVPGRIITLCQVSVTVVREGIWKELATVRKIDYQRPTQPRTYLPFNESQLIPGQQHYQFVIPIGDSTEVDVDHNLGTKFLAGAPLIAESVSGKGWTPNVDFEFDIISDNHVVFKFGVAPTVELFGVITTAGPVSTFINDLHIAIGNVDGLRDELDSLKARLSAIESLVPKGALVLTNSTTGTAQDIPLPDSFLVYPNARLGKDFDAASLTQATPAILAALPRPPALLPAIHDATITDFADGTLPTNPTAGNVYRNTNAAAVIIPGGGGRRESSIATGGFAGYDGRYWYPLTRSGDTNSFFPRDFELPLFPLLDFNNGLWSPGQVFSLEFDLDLRALRANTAAQYLLILRHGKANSQSAPAATAPNLDDINWFDVPLLTQRLILSGAPQKRHFGIQIKRGVDGTMSAKKLLQAAWSNADSCPLDPSFVLDGRIFEFDQQNSVANAVGYIYAAFTGAKASIQ